MADSASAKGRSTATGPDELALPRMTTSPSTKAAPATSVISLDFPTPGSPVQNTAEPSPVTA
jgi:hypothetical protein